MKKLGYILIAFVFIFAVLFLLFSGSAPTSELIEETDDSQNREIMYGTIENTLPDYAYLEGVTVRIAVTSGLAGADVLMDELATGASPYHFIEVMGCPGGCINGGGQPRCQEAGYREKRARALYSEDERKVLRKSHENPALQALYQEYLQSPGSHLAHELLHTHYTPRGLHNERLK